MFRNVLLGGIADVRQRQIRSIRGRHGLLRTSKLDAQGILDYLAREQPSLEHLPSIRKLVRFFREERRIWVTRDVCNEALTLARTGGNKKLVTTEPHLLNAPLLQENTAPSN